MAILESVLAVLGRAATGPVKDAAMRKDQVVWAMKKLRLDPAGPPKDFEVLYVSALVDCCYGKPDEVLGFFRDRYVREAFARAFATQDWRILDREVDSALERLHLTRQDGYLGPDVRDELSAFRATFDRLVDASRTPLQARLETTVDGIASSVALLLNGARSAAPQPAETFRKDDPRFLPNPANEVKALAGEGWAATLRGLYPKLPLVRFGGTEFPIWAELAHEDDWRDLEAPLGRLLDEVEPSFEEYDRGVDAAKKSCRRGFDPQGLDEYLYLQRTARKRSQHNGPAFAFERLRREGGRLRLDARPGTYFDSIATSEILEREFINAQASCPDEPLTLDALPRRHWLHERVSQLDRPDGASGSGVVFDGRFRAAALSVAVTMIFSEPRGTYSALLIPRSTEVLTHPGFVHVAPSGIFAPINRNWHSWRKEFSVKQTVLREYAEELFGYDELERNEGHYGMGVTQVPPVRRLLEAVDAGLVDLRYCGISVPLLTLRPEINVLVFIRDEDWFDEEMGRARHVDKKPFTPNWEYRPGQDRTGVKLDLDPDLNPIDLHGVIRPTRMVPHAAAALHLATQVIYRSA